MKKIFAIAVALCLAAGLVFAQESRIGGFLKSYEGTRGIQYFRVDRELNDNLGVFSDNSQFMLFFDHGGVVHMVDIKVDEIDPGVYDSFVDGLVANMIDEEFVMNTDESDTKVYARYDDEFLYGMVIIDNNMVIFADAKIPISEMGLSPAGESEDVIGIIEDDEPVEKKDEPKQKADDEPVPIQLVQTAPQFKGSIYTEFQAWVSRKVVYPEEARAAGISGTVIVQVIIGKDGYVKSARVLRSADPLLDREVLRAVMLSPQWTPGEQDGVKVDVGYVFPVSFYINN